MISFVVNCTYEVIDKDYYYVNAACYSRSGYLYHLKVNIGNIPAMQSFKNCKIMKLGSRMLLVGEKMEEQSKLLLLLFYAV